MVEVEKVVERQAVAPTAAPAATMASKAAESDGGSAGASDEGGAATSAYQGHRYDHQEWPNGAGGGEHRPRAGRRYAYCGPIIGGYVVSSETTLQGGFKYATLTLGVPVERFEKVQAEVRKLALRIVRDSASGEDVSDQYVDLQSRLANLEATEARIRTFLDQAKTVEEALKVNAPARGCGGADRAGEGAHELPQEPFRLLHPDDRSGAGSSYPHRNAHGHADPHAHAELLAASADGAPGRQRPGEHLAGARGSGDLGGGGVGAVRGRGGGAVPAVAGVGEASEGA